MNRYRIRKMALTSIFIMLTLNMLSAQHLAYMTVLRQADAKAESGVNNLKSKRFEASIKDFNDAIRYYQNAAKAPSKPDNALEILDSKIAECRTNINNARNIKANSVTLSVSSKNVAFSFNDSTVVIEVKSNRKDWKIDKTQTQDWCEPSHSVDVDKLIVKVKNNTSAEARTCAFEIVAGSKREKVEITQQALEISLDAYPKILTFDAATDSSMFLTVNVKCNTDWRIENYSSPDTLCLEKMNGSVIVSMIQDNDTQTEKSFGFDIVAGDKRLTINVIQAKAPIIDEPKRKGFPALWNKVKTTIIKPKNKQ